MSSRRKVRKKNNKWEVVNGLKSDTRFQQKPGPHQGRVRVGYWGKGRYNKATAFLTDGILSFHRRSLLRNEDAVVCPPSDSVIDLGLSIVWFENRRNIIVIEWNDVTYSLKVRKTRNFQDWIESIRKHRLYRQDQIAFGGSEKVRKLNFRQKNILGLSGKKNQNKIKVVPRGTASPPLEEGGNFRKIKAQLLAARLLHSEIGKTTSDSDSLLGGNYLNNTHPQKSNREQVAVSAPQDQYWFLDELVDTIVTAQNNIEDAITDIQGRQKERQSASAPNHQPKAGNTNSKPPKVSSVVLERAYSGNRPMFSPSPPTSTSVRKGKKQGNSKRRTNAKTSQLKTENNAKNMQASSSESTTASNRRIALPCKVKDQKRRILWDLLVRAATGRIGLPLTLFQPLSILQVLCEDLDYSYLLDLAAECDDAVSRMCLIAAFSISPYSQSQKRCGYKPFNPLLGETFELYRWDDKGWKFFSEQVSHHPPISAAHIEGKNGWTLWHDFTGSIRTTILKSITVNTDAKIGLRLRKYKEKYQWSRVNSEIKNFDDPEKRKVFHRGQIRLLSTNGLSCILNFEEEEKVVGWVLNGAGQRLVNLSGMWNEGLKREDSDNYIYHTKPLPPDSKDYYGFGYFARELNELHSDFADRLPPTDSRYRPDQRLLEQGNLDGAETKKKEVEVAQREREKIRLRKKELYKPLWFTPVPGPLGKTYWISNGTYWQSRNKNFKDISFIPLW